MSEHDQTQGAARAPEAPDETKAQVERQDRGAAAGRGAGSGGGERAGERRGGRRRHSGGGGGGRPPQQQAQQRRTEPALNMDELRELAELFTSHGLTDFEFENEEIRVRLSRNLGQPSAPAPSHAAAPPPTTSASTAPAAQQTDAAPGASSVAPAATPAEEKAEDLHIITSPIVGTFYRSPSPNAESFVKQGSRVESDTVVCIIEAMKLMNEIQAETTGTVEKIYVENGQPVEYGQPLFGIKK